MGIKASIMHGAAGLFLERPGREKSIAEWRTMLEQHGTDIDKRAASAKDPIQASKVLRHMSGIERWGQRRLRILLGDPPVTDEYDGYRPGTDLTLDEQRAVFRQTRAATLELVSALDAAHVSDNAAALHNDFGPLTARGWLRYLDMHSNLESKKISA